MVGVNFSNTSVTKGDNQSISHVPSGDDANYTDHIKKIENTKTDDERVRWLFTKAEFRPSDSESLALNTNLNSLGINRTRLDLLAQGRHSDDILPALVSELASSAQDHLVRTLKNPDVHNFGGALTEGILLPLIAKEYKKAVVILHPESQSASDAGAKFISGYGKNGLPLSAKDYSRMRQNGDEVIAVQKLGNGVYLPVDEAATNVPDEQADLIGALYHANRKPEPAGGSSGAKTWGEQQRTAANNKIAIGKLKETLATKAKALSRQECYERSWSNVLPGEMAMLPSSTKLRDLSVVLTGMKEKALPVTEKTESEIIHSVLVLTSGKMKVHVEYHNHGRTVKPDVTYGPESAENTINLKAKCNNKGEVTEYMHYTPNNTDYEISPDWDGSPLVGVLMDANDGAIASLIGIGRNDHEILLDRVRDSLISAANFASLPQLLTLEVKDSELLEKLNEGFLPTAHTNTLNVDGQTYMRDVDLTGTARFFRIKLSNSDGMHEILKPVENRFLGSGTGIFVGRQDGQWSLCQSLDGGISNEALLGEDSVFAVLFDGIPQVPLHEWTNPERDFFSDKFLINVQNQELQYYVLPDNIILDSNNSRCGVKISGGIYRLTDGSNYIRVSNEIHPVRFDDELKVWRFITLNDGLDNLFYLKKENTLEDFVVSDMSDPQVAPFAEVAQDYREIINANRLIDPLQDIRIGDNIEQFTRLLLRQEAIRHDPDLRVLINQPLELEIKLKNKERLLDVPYDNVRARFERGIVPLDGNAHAAEIDYFYDPLEVISVYIPQRGQQNPLGSNSYYMIDLNYRVAHAEEYFYPKRTLNPEEQQQIPPINTPNISLYQRRLLLNNFIVDYLENDGYRFIYQNHNSALNGIFEGPNGHTYFLSTKFIPKSGRADQIRLYQSHSNGPLMSEEWLTAKLNKILFNNADRLRIDQARTGGKVHNIIGGITPDGEVSIFKFPSPTLNYPVGWDRDL